jgi:hypothetical protein
MLLISMVLGCGEGSLCEGRIPSEAEVIQHGLERLESGFRDSGSGEPSSEVLADQDSLDSYLAEIGADSSPSVDFSAEVAFAHYWIDGGCDELTYTAVSIDGHLRLRRETVTGGCEAYMPTLDFVVVPHGGAEDIDFCEPVVEWDRRL